MEDRLAGAEEMPVAVAAPLRRPVSVYPQFDCGFDLAPATRLELSPAGAPATPVAELSALAVAIHPVQQVWLNAAPKTTELEQVPVVEDHDPAPCGDTMFALAGPRPADFAAAPRNSIEPIASGIRAQLPLDALRLNAAFAPALLVPAGLRALPVDRVAMIPGPWIDNLRAVDVHADGPQIGVSTPPMRPRLLLASGRRYSVGSRQAAIQPAAQQANSLPAPAPSISLPARNAEVLRSSGSAEPKIQEPNASGLVAVPIASAANDSGSAMRPAPIALSLPQPPRTEPMRPASKLEPIDAKPALEEVFPPRPEPAYQQITQYSIPQAMPEPPAPRPERAHIWVHAIDFWNRAPRDLKMLVFAIPLLLGLALHPSLPKVRVAAPAAASGFQKNFKTVVNQQLTGVRRSMLDRAAVALDEDFRSGLDEWVSRGDATTDWSFDAAGFVRPGPLAMYRPSMGLADYSMQFLGMIDKKAMSWVVRAADFDNYYVIKMVVTKPGPVPTIGVIRYAVINGKADSRGDVIVPVDARPDSIYRVRLDVHGDDFALSVQGQMVDSWSEPRLTHGGVGFFAAPGEESRVRWVQVTHQYDMLGRLCAYLAPYNTSMSGSWQQ